MTTKYTFWELLEKYTVRIPLIQRDYAQGRDTEKINEIRDSFLESLYQALSNGPGITLDFIYGTTEKNFLIPLDGQQRLTTLFLLHWYLATLNGQQEKASELLKNFTYETRSSSNEFCLELAEKGIPAIHRSKEKISGTIRDQSWYYLSWKHDPTIRGMLNMLDDIHLKFRNTKGLFKKLMETDSISFQFIAIENFGLTDSLYIKMNARGKPLTEFENFKAKFEQFLDRPNTKDFKERFSKSIDKEWTDFFWKNREQDRIDEAIMRFFRFITEMLWYSDSVGDPKTMSSSEFTLAEQVYSKEHHLEFLFDALDLLTELKNTDLFFDSVFSIQAETGKVRLFDVGRVNLLKCCFKNEKFDIKEKVLLFCLIQHLLKRKTREPDQDLRDLMRVVRNLLLRVRQQNGIEFNYNLRLENLPAQLSGIHDYLIEEQNVYEILSNEPELIIRGFSQDSIKAEIYKAELLRKEPALKDTLGKLEDHIYLKGALHNLCLPENLNEMQLLYKAFTDIWAVKKDSLITRALLTKGDYAVKIGNSNLGTRYFFGNHHKSRWYTVLTHSSEGIREVLTAFLKDYVNRVEPVPEARLKLMISEWMSESPEQNWRYYFIKYPGITETNPNLFAWTRENGFRIRSMSGNTLKAVHINPYVKMAIRKIDDHQICELSDSEGQDSSETPLKLKNGIRLYINKGHWSVSVPKGITLDPDLFTSFSLHPEEGKENVFKLKESQGDDLIERAVLFCKAAGYSYQ